MPLISSPALLHSSCSCCSFPHFPCSLSSAPCSLSHRHTQKVPGRLSCCLRRFLKSRSPLLYVRQTPLRGGLRLRNGPSPPARGRVGRSSCPPPLRTLHRGRGL